MIVPPTGIRVLMATKPVDFRKGIRGAADAKTLSIVLKALRALA
jgi:hypothetical protein